MKTHSVFVSLLVASLALPTVAQARGGICDAAQLTTALAAATSGDTVRIGACQITGSFQIPAGVTLRGVNSYASRIVAPINTDALTLTPGATTTRVRHLTVEHDGGIGIGGTGAGSVWVDRVRVRTARGVAIGFEDVSQAAVTHSQVRGPVDASNADSVDIHTSSLDTATHGVLLVRVADASVDGVTARGFTNFGILAVESVTGFWGVLASQNVGVGVGVFGGSADFDFVSARRTFSGIRPVGDFPSGVVVAGGATVTSTGLSSSRSEGFGVFEDGASSDHDFLSSRYNDNAGIWTQNALTFQLDRSSSSFNDFANVVAVDSAFASISRSAINFAQETTPPGFLSAGDGIQLVNTPGDISDVSLIANERAGLIGDLGPTMIVTDIDFSDVFVVGFGDSLGAILQQGPVTISAPDDGVTRLGAVAGNDADFILVNDPIDPAGGVQPCFLPQMEFLVDAGILDLFDPLI
ncbi:MAG: hypothetical protein AAGF12_09175 [Myxococcota bacterium]